MLLNFRGQTLRESFSDVFGFLSGNAEENEKSKISKKQSDAQNLQKFVIFVHCVLLNYDDSSIPLDVIKYIIYFTLPQIPPKTLDIEQYSTLSGWVSEDAWKKNWTLIYQASKDGFSASQFHKRCDHKKNTCVLIVTKEKNVFGGYTNASWEGNGEWKTDPDAFIFTIRNPNNIPMTKFPIERVNSAIFCSPGYGPIFGEGNDIYVATDSNLLAGNYSRTHFPGSYKDTTGMNLKTKTFTGSESFFQTSDVIVFHIT